NDAQLLSVFPGDSQPFRGGQTRYSADFTASGSTWVANADERDVFQAVIAHESKDEHAWTIRIGKGGMIYSFLGPFGESIPPQREKSVWNDEVWQLVAVSSEKLGPAQQAAQQHPKLRDDLRSFFYFAHQSGTYNRDPLFDGTFYSPLLLERYDEATRSYTCLNWIQQAHVPSVWQSHLFCYQRVRDAGSGVIELSYILVNAGGETINHMNVPWGGVRYSSLPKIMVSQAGGGWEHREGEYGPADTMTRASNTAGWIGWSAREQADSPALLLVHGDDSADGPTNIELDAASLQVDNKRPSVVRWGTAIKHAPERDYSVATLAWKPTIEPGQAAYYRSYFIVGPRDEAITKAAELAPLAGGGRLVFDVEQPATVGIGKGDEEKALHAYAYPIANAKPLLLIRNTDDNKLIVTSDPYLLAPSAKIANPMPKDHPRREIYDNRMVYRPHLAPVEFVALLGYALPVNQDGSRDHVWPKTIETSWGRATIADDIKQLQMVKPVP
ncbi:MAG: hypothetical protein AAF085_14110, partial [Planctomycetota bacterium]